MATCDSAERNPSSIDNSNYNARGVDRVCENHHTLVPFLCTDDSDMYFPASAATSIDPRTATNIEPRLQYGISSGGITLHQTRSKYYHGNMRQLDDASMVQADWELKLLGFDFHFIKHWSLFPSADLILRVTSIELYKH